MNESIIEPHHFKKWCSTIEAVFTLLAEACAQNNCEPIGSTDIDADREFLEYEFIRDGTLDKNQNLLDAYEAAAARKIELLNK